MECCQTTLKSRIPSEDPPNPGKLSPEHPVRRRSVKTVAKYVRQISQALTYLHTRNFVHRDLKPQNILLTADDDVKLTDVGQTRRESEISGTRCGTGCYSAPEILAGLTHSCSADVFSLGILLWELWYGKTAQSDIEIRDSVKADAEFAVMKGTRPSLANVHVPPENWKDLVRRSWHHDPAERPSANECVKFFARYSPCDFE
ncbi:hypothetical protein CAPTEDRAFT_138535 [Capitella teleta]|uniref:Protein kinase domain-containing protein n=1 Tax=Capitella teleta TaxID=283909 RepID=R7VHL6_CAPTE|nr:hypothetical protein CAPTEDRAFT_138535 [Capitella teleta]|eukprot:ELU15165.1 hypothetical protein CAPTEDRAFT_138535 [Capitella teleta]